MASPTGTQQETTGRRFPATPTVWLVSEGCTGETHLMSGRLSCISVSLQWLLTMNYGPWLGLVAYRVAWRRSSLRPVEAPRLAPPSVGMMKSGSSSDSRRHSHQHHCSLQVCSSLPTDWKQTSSCLQTGRLHHFLQHQWRGWGGTLFNGKRLTRHQRTLAGNVQDPVQVELLTGLVNCFEGFVLGCLE